jgi:hypothetical protein
MCADLSLPAKLGYQPRVSLQDGLRLTLERDARFKGEQTPLTQDPASEPIS